MHQSNFNNMVKLCRSTAVLLFIMFFAVISTACRNNTTCLPLGWSGGGGQTGSGGGTGPNPPIPPSGIFYIPDLIPGSAVLNVYDQLAWIHANQDEIHGGADRVYVAIAHCPINILGPAGVFEIVPGATGIGIDFSNVSNVNVRIQSDDPLVSRPINLQGSGIMINVGETNTLTLYKVDLVGLPGNASPLVDVGYDGILIMEDSEIKDNFDGIGVRVTNGGTLFMNTGADVHNNEVGVQLTGNTAELVMTDAEIRDNSVAGVAITNGNLFMNAGSHVHNNDVGVELTGNAATLTMTNAEISDSTGPGVLVNGGAVFMNAGSHIHNNDAGVQLASNTALTMTNAQISANTGLGVLVNGAALTMNTGSHIHNNDAGVQVIGSTASLTMTGAEIRNNTALGVLVNGGTLTMNAGSHVHNNTPGVEVVGNTATLTMTNAQVRDNTGRGVIVNSAATPQAMLMTGNSQIHGNTDGAVELIGANTVFTMTNSMIWNNGGRAVRVGAGTFNMNAGAVVQGQNANIQPVVYVAGGTLAMTGTNTNRSEIRNGGTAASSPVNFGSDLTVAPLPIRTFDVGGGRGVLVTNGGNFTMGTGSKVHGHMGGGVLLMGSNMTMNGNATVYGNYSTEAGNDLGIVGTALLRPSGGGINAINGSNIVMNNQSRVEKNLARGWGGGGISLYASHLVMNHDALIYNNDSIAHQGGGIQTRSNSVTTIRMRNYARVENNRSNHRGPGVAMEGNLGRFYMENSAKVINNATTTRDGGGSGVAVGVNNILFMLHNETEISGNHAFHTSGVLRIRNGIDQVRLHNNAGGAGTAARLYMSGGRIYTPTHITTDLFSTSVEIRGPVAGIAQAFYGYNAGTGLWSQNGISRISIGATCRYSCDIFVVDGHRQPCRGTHPACPH